MMEPTELLDGRREWEDLASRTLPELRTLLVEVEERVRFAEEHGAEAVFVNLLRNDGRAIRAELARRGNGLFSLNSQSKPVLDAEALQG